MCLSLLPLCSGEHPPPKGPVTGLSTTKVEQPGVMEVDNATPEGSINAAVAHGTPLADPETMVRVLMPHLTQMVNLMASGARAALCAVELEDILNRVANFQGNIATCQINM